MSSINVEKVNLLKLVKQTVQVKKDLASFKKDKDKILSEIEGVEERLQEQEYLLNDKKGEFESLAKEENKIKNSLLKLDKEWLIQEVAYKKDIIELKEERDKLLIITINKKVEISGIEEEKGKKIEKLDKEIEVKNLRNTELDKIAEEKLREINTRVKDLDEIVKEIDKKGSSVILKDEAVVELKEEISDLEQEKEEKQNQVKVVEKEVKELKYKRSKEEEKFKVEQLKVSNLVIRQKEVEMKAKEVKELYKKAGQDINL